MALGKSAFGLKCLANFGLKGLSKRCVITAREGLNEALPQSGRPRWVTNFAVIAGSSTRGLVASHLEDLVFAEGRNCEELQVVSSHDIFEFDDAQTVKSRFAIHSISSVIELKSS